jgi:hypothetical protein
LNDWKKVKLSDIIEFNPRETLSKGAIAKKIAMEKLEPFTRDIPEFEYLEFRGGTKFRNGDTLMARITPSLENGKTSKVNLLDEDEVGFGSTEFIVVRAKENISDENFVYYLMIAPSIREVAIKSMVGTSGRQRVQLDVVKNHEILCPPLKEQIRIGKILKALDDKIENNKKINHHLEQMAQAIFKSWFIDFEPFGGVKPFDWQEGVFSEIVSSTLSGDWGKENPMGNYQKMVYCMRGADLPEITFGNKGKMPVRYISPKNFTNKQLTANNIVIEISGGSPTQSTGRCALITQSLLDRYECDMVCTNFCRAIKPKEGYSEFIYYYWRYLYEHNIMFLYENGTTGIKNLDISSFLENEKIIIPTLNSVHKFSNIVQKLRNTIATNGLEIEKLTNLRDTLLPKLLSGEISVNQATK